MICWHAIKGFVPDTYEFYFLNLLLINYIWHMKGEYKQWNFLFEGESVLLNTATTFPPLATQYWSALKISTEEKELLDALVWMIWIMLIEMLWTLTFVNIFWFSNVIHVLLQWTKNANFLWTFYEKKSLVIIYSPQFVKAFLFFSFCIIITSDFTLYVGWVIAWWPDVIWHAFYALLSSGVSGIPHISVF